MNGGIGAGLQQPPADVACLRRGRIGHRQSDDAHRGGQVGGGSGSGVEAVGQEIGGLAGQLAVSRSQRRATKAMVEVDRLGDRKEAAGVGGAGPVELGEVALLEAVRDGDRMQTGLSRRRGMEERAALRCAQPFVAVADIPVGTDRA